MEESSGNRGGTRVRGKASPGEGGGEDRSGRVLRAAAARARQFCSGHRRWIFAGAARRTSSARGPTPYGPVRERVRRTGRRKALSIRALVTFSSASRPRLSSLRAASGHGNVFPRAKRDDDGDDDGGGGGGGGSGGSRGRGGGASKRRRRTRDNDGGRGRGTRPERGSKRPPDQGINRRRHEETPRGAHGCCYCFIINEAGPVASLSKNASVMSAEFER
ncbi:growth/differentiation factor 7-like [Cataglyphis hispanica]|uniref:growth/differentiation factor 7-like n=1 Tax=Cataglyphis hispanica TaxID=1086592 RepID=UPI0021800ED6|nr:growth/differentiation factor 7-like [Cataglyphis hispanica]